MQMPTMFPEGTTVDDFDPEVVARAREIAAELRAQNNDPEAVESMRHFQNVVLAYGAPLFRRLTTTSLREYAARPDATDAEKTAAANMIAEIERFYDQDTDGSLILSDRRGRPVARLGLAAVPCAESLDATVAELTALFEGNAAEAREHLSRLLSMYVQAYIIAGRQHPTLTECIGELLGCDASRVHMDRGLVNMFLRNDTATRYAIRVLPIDAPPAAPPANN